MPSTVQEVLDFPENATYYEILGIIPTATETEVRNAFKKLAIKIHPDRNPMDESKALEASQRIGQAHNVLSDPRERRAYDLGLKRYENPRGENPLNARQEPKTRHDIFASTSHLQGKARLSRTDISDGFAYSASNNYEDFINASAGPSRAKQDRSTFSIRTAKSKPLAIGSNQSKTRNFFSRKPTPPTTPQSPKYSMSPRMSRANSSPGPEHPAPSLGRSSSYRSTGSGEWSRRRRGSGESGGYDVASESKDKERSRSQDSVRSAGTRSHDRVMQRNWDTDSDRLKKMEKYARQMLHLLHTLREQAEHYRELYPIKGPDTKFWTRKRLDDQSEESGREVSEIAAKLKEEHGIA
ncbi:MAG: hypothetical protein Q9227_007953 [Pyrenula ochraceoflavens]